MENTWQIQDIFFFSVSRLQCLQMRSSGWSPIQLGDIVQWYFHEVLIIGNTYKGIGILLLFLRDLITLLILVDTV